MTPDITWKTHDTYPPWVFALSQNGALIDLTSATSIKTILKGTATLVTSTGAKLTVVTPTGTLASGSNVITSVSSFTNVQVGGTIQDLVGGKIPANARVGSFNAAAGTINMTDAQGVAVNATGSGSVITLTINFGCYAYTPLSTDLATVDNWNIESEITWTGGGVQTVPNVSYNTATTLADLEGA